MFYLLGMTAAVWEFLFSAAPPLSQLTARLLWFFFLSHFISNFSLSEAPFTIKSDSELHNNVP